LLAAGAVVLTSDIDEARLQKVGVRRENVGNAVVFFASDQTPTTGATLPVDSGIPAAFPR
jgi:enoyl-[acyl-carrier-protein] reductase (NADH)